MALSWKTAGLPPWTDASPRRLHALLIEYQRVGLEGRDLNEYTSLLLQLTLLRFGGKGWNKSLRKAGLDAEDVVQDTVMHLLRKTKTMNFKFQGHLPMLSVLNQTIVFFVITAIKSRSKRAEREVSATDYYVTHGKQSEEPGHEMPENPEPPSQEMCIAVLMNCEDDVIGDLKTRDQAEAEAVERVFGLLRDLLINEQELIPHGQLPYNLRQEVPIERYGLICGRFNRIVRSLGRV